MSYVLHHAIVVTAHGAQLDKARTQAVELGMLVTEIV